MNALLWKRYKEIRTNKIKLFITLVLPIIYFALLTGFSVPRHIIVSYFSLACMLIGNLGHWNIEDLVHSETLLTTPLTPFKLWFANWMLVAGSGFIIAQIYLLMISFGSLLISGQFYISDVLYFIENIAFSFLGFSLLAAATVHNVDFTKWKQYLTGVFSIFNFLFPFAPFLFASILPTGIWITLGAVALGILLTTLSLLIARSSRRERLVLNIQKLSEAYEIKLLND
ncbi:hypothetical protein [Paenibacillus sp. HW567]|uniref:hypothetical protein n=1 Tax=Paenibacillus sp. HW567 TaxID=1034769 RepID=UPI000372D95D|nr:hypothetical protein [Paenibacillus sp. HW567]